MNDQNIDNERAPSSSDINASAVDFDNDDQSLVYAGLEEGSTAIVAQA